jgi:hypothetical protein
MNAATLNAIRSASNGATISGVSAVCGVMIALSSVQSG